MCDNCNADVALAGEGLDRMISRIKEIHEQHPGGSGQQRATTLAIMMMEGYVEHQGMDALHNLCLGYAIAVQRLVAAEEIYGTTA